MGAVDAVVRVSPCRPCHKATGERSLESMLSLRSAGFALVSTLLLAPEIATAQPRPAFDGTWVLVGAAADQQRTTVVAPSGDAAFRTGDMGSGWGSSLSFSRRADRLVLEYPYFGAYDLMAPVHFEFALDGREVINEVTVGPGVTRFRTRAAWRGDTLVITTQQAVPPEVGGANVFAEVQRALTLRGSDSLHIITTRVGVRGAPTNTVLATFARKR